MMRPAQRGGAGGVDRRTSGTTAGPASARRMIGRFAFAIRLPAAGKTRGRRMQAVADAVDDLGHAAIVDEWDEGCEHWLSVRVQPPIPLKAAQRFVLDVPGYVVGTVQPDRE